MTATVAPVVTRRVWRNIAPRRTVWVDPSTGGGVWDDGAPVTVPVRPSVSDLLERCAAGAQVVNLTGGRPGGDADGFHRWLNEPLPAGWTHGGHYLKRLTMPLLRFVHESGRVLEVQRAAAWFGDGDYLPIECAAALELAGELISERFGDGAMRVRPAATGQELLLRTVPDDGLPCPPLEIAELIRSTAGQGRIEHVPHPQNELTRLVEYDGRFMYAALCRELPQGVPVHGSGDGGFDTWARGRFLVEWRVPRWWRHLGLLPMMQGDTWTYPRVPGARGRGWVDAVELHLARAQGWDARVVEHLVWPHRGKPLDSWSARLIAARDAVALRASADELGERVAGLARAALRAVCLFGLGAFTARPFMVTHTAALGATVLPDDAQNVTLDGSTVVYEVASRRGGPAIEHPEWPATVWARCRVRMLSGPGGTGALHVPLEQVVGIHTDALYLTADPGWSDDGAAGRLRRKAMWPGPFLAPRDDGELIRLVRRLRGGGGGS